MTDKNKIVELMNRDTGSVTYIVPDTGARRTFSAGETKRVTFDELEKLAWADGGKELLQDYLIIKDKEVAEELLGSVEPEYFYTKEDIDKLLVEGSVAQLQDTLEFGPKGVIDLIKQEAVNLKVDSTVKRDEIKNATNFNVSRSIELNDSSDEDNNSNAASHKRRTNPITETTQRRSEPIAASGSNSTPSGSKYKIIN